MIIKIENPRLRTVVGIFDWEKRVKQDIVINIETGLDGRGTIEEDYIRALFVFL